MKLYKYQFMYDDKKKTLVPIYIESFDFISETPQYVKVIKNLEEKRLHKKYIGMALDVQDGEIHDTKTYLETDWKNTTFLMFVLANNKTDAIQIAKSNFKDFLASIIKHLTIALNNVNEIASNYDA